MTTGNSSTEFEIPKRTAEPKVWRDDIEMVIGKLSEAKAVLELVGMSDYAKLVDKPITELSRIHAEMGEAFIEPYRFTTKAQEVMRHEMTTPKINAPCTVEPTIERRKSNKLMDEAADFVEDTTLKGIKTVASAMDEVLGEQSERPQGVRELAWTIINESEGVNLSLAQWNKVQQLVEEGIVRGFSM